MNFEQIIGAIVIVFIIYCAWRDWLFAKTLRDTEKQRQEPLKDMSNRILAKDLNDLKYQESPNEVSNEDPNEFDLTEDLNLRIPKEFSIEVEDASGETLAEKEFKDQ